MINRITKEELEMIDAYRKKYAWTLDGHHTKANYAPIKDVLAPWRDHKEILYKLLGEELKIEKKFSFEKSPEMIRLEFKNLFDKETCDTIRQKKANQFLNNFEKMIAKKGYDNKDCYNFYDLLLIQNLIDNKYSGKTVSLCNEEGKKIEIKNGDKVIKAIHKVAKFYNVLDGFEDFRICHSQILNQKKIEGTLTLSIHPMDFMTMSDNKEKWSTCTSWKEKGAYRQGTVQGMNSSTIIMAYLSNDSKNMDITEEHQWNSKKWRVLFHVDDAMIISIRQFPYDNESLLFEAGRWIKKLAEKNLGYKYCAFRKHDFDEDLKVDEKTKVTLRSNTDYMYDDFGVADYHLLAFNKEKILSLSKKRLSYCEEDYNFYTNNYEYTFYTYGPSQCMICGEEWVDLYDDSCLACGDCEEIVYCGVCGEVIDLNGEEWVKFEDCYYCEDCKHMAYKNCEESKEEIILSNHDTITLKIVDELHPTKEHLIDDGFIEAKYNKRFFLYFKDFSLFKKWVKRNLKKHGKVYSIRYLTNSFMICEEDLKDIYVDFSKTNFYYTHHLKEIDIF